MIRSRNTIAVPPGATIKEQLQDRGLSQKEFATRMNMSEKHISKLINGEVHLTQDVAMRLEMVLGVPARFWNGLEMLYREDLLQVKAENEMDTDIEISKKFPYREMVKNKWISDSKKPQERVLFLRKFFEVAELSLLTNPSIMPIACRRVSSSEKSDYALLAWAQEAKIEAREIEVKPINLMALRKAIPSIRKMSTMSPTDFCPKLCKTLSDCGIAVVFLPHIGGSFLHGATFYDKNKIVIGLTVRGKDADKFWFSLFHELAHILEGHINQPKGTTQQDEVDADNFAQNTLIDKEALLNFINKKDYRKEAISSFAKEIGIDKGIVVGRLQKEGYLKYSEYNDMKTKYCISA